MAGAVDPGAARDQIRQLRDHMLDTLDALGEIRGEAHSDEIEPAPQSAAGGASRTPGAHAGNDDMEPEVRATVNGNGTLVGLELSTAAMRRTPDELRDSLVATAALAARRAAAAHAAVMRNGGWATTESAQAGAPENPTP